MLLERTDQLSALTHALDEVTAARAGAVVFVGGEAGAGKTVLLRAFCDGQRGAVRILWGACEGLLTPGPLGPLFDVAEVTGGELEELVSREARPHEVAGALVRELARGRPTVLVLEDLHWADEATLDVLRLLARKVQGVPALVLASYRDDELDRVHPLTLVLGELATARAVTRLAIPPLSEQAVGELAAPHGIDPGELHRQTNGNPFYVTEVLAAGTGEIPHTVRDAVLARLARLSAAARRLLEAIAIATPPAEVWLLEALAPAELHHLEECLASGMVAAQPDGVAFRHELARLAVAEALPPHRRVALHRAATAALAARSGRARDPARIAHHADVSGDGAAVLRFAPAAAERAASLGAHREAAAQYARALRFAEDLAPTEQAALLEGRAYECFLTGELEAAIAAQERALALRRALGDPLLEGDCLRSLSRLYRFLGRTEE
ncbi:MAG TPA: AAA family ATPase, partial [Solirubrobacteraceae bacterium]